LMSVAAYGNPRAGGIKGIKISDGDELIVNRALEPVDGSVVVAVLDGELTIKRLRITGTGVVLQAENPAYRDIRVPSLHDPGVGGVPPRRLTDETVRRAGLA